LHISWAASGDATDERRDTVELIGPMLAIICDSLRTPQVLAETVAPTAHAIVLSTHGTASELPGRESGLELQDGSPLRRLLAKPKARQYHRRFLWRDSAGACRRIEVIPCRGGLSLIIEEAVAWPYGVTARELEILYLVAAGSSNPEIGQSLFVSPRTVSTHVEHLLSKLGCTSRTQLATMAVNEGLLLGESPGIRSGEPMP
jgi:DNA-binding CsgD family transcriptional regulator